MGEPGIHIDWEHESWQWHDPREIIDGTLLGVPRLQDTLKRVYFETDLPVPAGKVLAISLHRMQDDRESGSRQLTTIALESFRDFISNMPTTMDEQWWRMVRLGAWHLSKNGRESMGASILNALLAVLRELGDFIQEQQQVQQELQPRKRQPEEEKDLHYRVLTIVDRHIGNRYTMTARIRDYLSGYLRSHCFAKGDEKRAVRVLTVSSSSTIKDTILEAFAELDAQTLDLRILESRPLYEGVTLASSVVSQFKYRFGSPSDERRLEVSVYTDASAVTAAQHADVLLIGADRVSAEGGVCNKIGSLSAVLGAKYTWPNLQIVVVTESDKISPAYHGADMSNKMASNEENDPREVTAGWNAAHVKNLEELNNYLIGTGHSIHYHDEFEARIKFQVRNVYFEWVPLRLIDAIICEDGVLDTGTIAERSTSTSECADLFFGKL